MRFFTLQNKPPKIQTVHFKVGWSDVQPEKKGRLVNTCIDGERRKGPASPDPLSPSESCLGAAWGGSLALELHRHSSVIDCLMLSMRVEVGRTKKTNRTNNKNMEPLFDP